MKSALLFLIAELFTAMLKLVPQSETRINTSLERER